MLEIHIRGRKDVSVSFLTLDQLLRTVRVVADTSFVEPREGALLNLAHVVQIVEGPDEEDDVAADEAEQEAAEPVNVVGPLYVLGTPRDACPHGYIPSTCSECKRLATEVEQEQPLWW